MTTEEIKHLGTLSRLALQDEEITAFRSEIEAILGYVSQLNILTNNETLTKETGVVKNVLRADTVTIAPGSYTKTLLEAAPHRQGDYILVKKIIEQDE